MSLLIYAARCFRRAFTARLNIVDSDRREYHVTVTLRSYYEGALLPRQICLPADAADACLFTAHMSHTRFRCRRATAPAEVVTPRRRAADFRHADDASQMPAMPRHFADAAATPFSRLAYADVDYFDVTPDDIALMILRLPPSSLIIDYAMSLRRRYLTMPLPQAAPIARYAMVDTSMLRYAALRFADACRYADVAYAMPRVLIFSRCC